VRSNLIKITITQGARERYRCVNLGEQDEKVNISGDSGSVSHVSTRDKQGRLTHLTDGTANSSTYYVYDDLGRKVKVTSDQRGEQTYDYNASTGLMTN
jgi:YD repeat-containing protein